MLAADGLAGYLCGVVIGQPVTIVAVAVLAAIATVQGCGMWALTRLGRMVRRQRVAATWAGWDFLTAPTVWDAGALTTMAHMETGYLIGDCLRGYQRHPPTKRRVQQGRDLVVRHLHAADHALRVALDALERPA